MKKILHIILISLFSLTVISYAKKSSTSSSDTTDTTVSTSSQMGGSIQGAELSLSPLVTSVAGIGSGGSAYGTGTSASFSKPYGITLLDGVIPFLMFGKELEIKKLTKV